MENRKNRKAKKQVMRRRAGTATIGWLLRGTCLLPFWGLATYPAGVPGTVVLTSPERVAEGQTNRGLPEWSCASPIRVRRGPLSVVPGTPGCASPEDVMKFYPKGGREPVSVRVVFGTKARGWAPRR